MAGGRENEGRPEKGCQGPVSVVRLPRKINEGREAMFLRYCCGTL